MTIKLNQELIQRIHIEVVGRDDHSYNSCFVSLILDLPNLVVFYNSDDKMKVMIFH